LVFFQEINDRDQAEALGGQYLFVPTSSAPQLPEGEYWPHELMGSTVVTTEGRTIGEIEEIIHTPANDVWVARAEGREVLIPALKDVVESVDVHGRRVVVREVPGLTVP
jgi:16S rRNA processing protein RimM